MLFFPLQKPMRRGEVHGQLSKLKQSGCNWDKRDKVTLQELFLYGPWRGANHFLFPELRLSNNNALGAKELGGAGRAEDMGQNTRVSTEEGR